MAFIITIVPFKLVYKKKFKYFISHNLNKIGNMKYITKLVLIKSHKWFSKIMLSNK